MKLKILAFAVGLTLPTNLSAQTFTVLHSFAGSDGTYPAGRLIVSGNTLYGAALNGGSYGWGAVFNVNIDGSGFTVLHSFTAPLGYPGTNGDGIRPNGLIISGNALYGTTEEGGIGGNGTVFKINTDSTQLTTLYSFPATPGASRAFGPAAAPILSGNTLYGTAGGGDYESGIVFKVNTDGSDFTYVVGFPYVPTAGVILSGNTLYGVADGVSGLYAGMMFSVNTDGSDFTNLYTYNDGEEGCSGLILSGNTFYGAAWNGGSYGWGTVFNVNIDGSGFTVLHSFTGGMGGAYPTGLTLSGNTLYGTTYFGGTSTNYGEVFAVNTDGSGFTNLHSFTGGNDGANPLVGVILLGNTLYGTTEYAGNGGNGTVFALSLEPSAPIITTQPQSQTAQAGSNIAFSVVASGLPSPNYQWQFNGQNIAGQRAASLSLTNVQFANAGGYLVIVTDAYGSVTSTVAQLTVFTNLVVAQTNEPPPPPGKPTIPTNAIHFKVFSNGGFVTGIGLDRSKSTIVLTHGWKDSSTIWPLEMANNIKLELGASTPNIVAWDWTAEANDALTSAANKTLGQGYALGTNLVAALGANHSMRIHFIGHSLGTMVNAKAANIVHRLGFSWTNTQMTLFDEASVASGVTVHSLEAQRPEKLIEVN
jgi:uncharacterized repeat protein (TIGR03803 family)